MAEKRVNSDYEKKFTVGVILITLTGMFLILFTKFIAPMFGCLLTFIWLVTAPFLELLTIGVVLTWVGEPPEPEQEKI